MSFNSAFGSGSSSWRGRRQGDSAENPVFCICEVEGKKLKASIMTSWTEDNPGRRFYGCRNWKARHCGFFDWIDAPITERAKEVINDLKSENLKLMKVKHESSKTETMDVELEIERLWGAMQTMKEDSKKMMKKTSLVSFLFVASWVAIAYYAIA
ncbi:uncharacterized protein LOC130989795 [Salvia miltiorrhiza]|uniref:uncharacterized protein LOC130989795 n=1 Tax=Salvia miltiorrhiza TaxID=226208 RepID=UPI0025AD1DAA|nr:uncharacterized protein LOC130989795 [Salvia miltiorrhiza]